MKWLLGNWIFLLFLTSCSGYRLNYPRNPFLEEGVTSLSVPLFINHSSVSGVSAPFTREIMRSLQNYEGPYLFSRENPQADAVLLGFITGPQQLKEAVQNAGTDEVLGFREESNTLSQDGDKVVQRPGYLISRTGLINLRVTLIMIKNPTWNDIKNAKDYPDLFLKGPSSKVVFTREFNLQRAFSYPILFRGETDYIASRSHYLKQQAIRNMGINLATLFKSEVLDVF